MDNNQSKPVYLIVNADDFGYFASVSHGIVACAQKGAVTATGVMANGPRFEEVVPWLRELPRLDVGVHLNITYGRPLSAACRRVLAPLGGQFLPKAGTALLILQNKLPLAVVRQEWRLQIERCLAAGLTPCFLNTHEHMHILPGLVGVMRDLAREYRIDHVRWPRTQWRTWPSSVAGVARNLMFLPINLLNGTLVRPNPIPVIGLGVSGRLTRDDLEHLLSGLERGRVYELMCHPGFFDPHEIGDRRLCGFHAWQQEVDVLTGEGFKNLLRRRTIRLIGYRELAHACPSALP